ncbi:winged-helix domain-containing protein, partial [Candidatus Neomarinimicrobiota bacterium]
MTEPEMILKVLEESSKPLTSKNIAKIIFHKFKGYKMHRTIVRNHLWNKNNLKKIVLYDKSEYTYQLKSNLNAYKDIIIGGNDIFNYKIENGEKDPSKNIVYSYKVKGDNVIIESYIDNSCINNFLISLVKTEIEFASSS